MSIFSLTARWGIVFPQLYPNNLGFHDGRPDIDNDEKFFFIALNEDKFLMGKCSLFRLKSQDEES